MKSFKNFRLFNRSILTVFLFSLGLLLIPLSTSCSASLVREMDQTDARKIVRDRTKDGKWPSETIV
ncbi:hypothetical protein BH20ACI1_BH20ACI1_32110 [soil metagenome]